MTNKETEVEALRKELNEIYTPLEEAKKEIWRRWNDKELRKKVEEYLGGDVPSFLKKKPKAYLAKHVASPNLNFFEYLDLAKKIELEPIIPEYHSDKFVSKNQDKYHLGKLFFYDGEGKNGGLKIDTEVIIDFHLAEGKKFKEIETLWGENFIKFHNRILFSLVKDIGGCVVDVSDWVARNGSVPEKFYLNFLTLFIRNGVLFENFLDKTEKDRNFSRQVVLSNFKKVNKMFGVKPLIVPTVPIELENELHLWCYPNKVKNLLYKK